MAGVVDSHICELTSRVGVGLLREIVMRLRKDLQDLRRAEALQRNTLWRSRSTQEQLQQLDMRLGSGVGAKRQRAKLEQVK